MDRVSSEWGQRSIPSNVYVPADRAFYDKDRPSRELVDRLHEDESLRRHELVLEAYGFLKTFGPGYAWMSYRMMSRNLGMMFGPDRVPLRQDWHAIGSPEATAGICSRCMSKRHDKRRCGANEYAEPSLRRQTTKKCTLCSMFGHHPNECRQCLLCRQWGHEWHYCGYHNTYDDDLHNFELAEARDVWMEERSRIYRTPAPRGRVRHEERYQGWIPGASYRG